MPLVDMPIEELRSYQGRNPMPADMDAYWDRALAEMRATDPDVEMEPHAHPSRIAECFHLRFTGVGGSRVHAKYLRPASGGRPHPAVLLFHGYAGSSGDWTDKLTWVSQGFSVAALDCRGQGGQSEHLEPARGNTLRGHIVRGLDDHPDRLYYRQVFLDTAEIARIVMGMPEVDAARVCATGGSQGGALTLACAALEPGICKAAPVFPFLCDFLRVWEMDLASNAYEELRTFFRLYDPRHERRDDIFTRLGYIDLQHLAHRIEAEILMVTGLMDTICPPSTQFAAYNKIRSPKQMVIYPDYGHESLPESSDIIFEFLAGL